ncbi:ATP synthase F1 subunit delta [Anaerostipes sp.]|uniref:ATP synthase F1 subunit delta n=1 Tax=Anaerostipes sp. TaxID=1872530 RepID=UPI0025C1EB25|nr:ATP synthase F1 subunit delta [Anaerostipes sp.]MBS7006894.1 ATP synthase F1 subunit delta [Anaerostipes sp.]
MAKLVSKTYGDAYLSLAEERNTLDAVKEEVLAVRQVFLESGELNQMLSHPKIVKEEKMRILETAFKGRISEDMMGFLLVIVKKDRYRDIMSILDYIIGQMKKKEGIGSLKVASAFKLSEGQKADIVHRMKELTDYQEFEVDYEVDESLIGGLVLRLEDRVIDSSIRTKLQTMGRSLSKIQL